MRLIFLLNEAKLTVLLSIRYENISDSGDYTIPYSFCTVFISVFISYCIHHRLRVNGKALRYENIPDSFESDII